MGNVKGTLSKWYKGLALDQQRVYQRELEKQMLQNPVQGLTTAVELQHQMQQQSQLGLQQQKEYEKYIRDMRDAYEKQERDREKMEQVAQVKLGRLQRILSSLVFQLRILDLDAIEDKKTSTVPLRVPVKVIKELLEELDGKDTKEWPVYPDFSRTTEATISPQQYQHYQHQTATSYPAKYANIYSTSDTAAQPTTKKGV